MQPRFPTHRWHCGIRVTATFPTTSSENYSKRWRSAAMDMRERAEAMGNWNEGCRLHQKAYSVTKLLHKTTNISLKVRDTIPSWKEKRKKNSNQPKLVWWSARLVRMVWAQAVRPANHLKNQISILEWFLKDHVTLKTWVIAAEITEIIFHNITVLNVFLF